MASTDLVRKRLAQLKRLSVQLKQTTDHTSAVDYNLLKDILYASKNINNKKQQISTKIKQMQKNDSDQLPRFNTIYQDDQNLQLFPQDNKKLFEQLRSIKSGQSYTNKQQEIYRLKRQNLQLQKMVDNLKLKLSQYQINNKKYQEDKWKEGLPFFTFYQQIQIFSTKLVISQKDYNKIDYILSFVELQLDKIVIKKKKGKDFKKQFYLNDLKEVYYVENQIIILIFKDHNSQIETLFMKFIKVEDHHRWDLGIYINFKIVESLHQSRLFGQMMISDETYKKGEFNQSTKNYQEQAERIKEKIKQSDNNRIKNLLEQKKFKKQKNYSDQFSDQIKSPQEGSLFSQKISQISQKSPTIIINQLKENVQISQDQTQKKERENTSKFGITQIINSSNLQQNKKNNQAIQSIKKSQQQKINKERQEINKKIQQKRRIQQIINRLKIGYQFTKYAEGGFSPHQKKIYLTSNNQYLCLEDLSKSQVKKHKLTDIMSATYKKIGKGIKKHVTNPKAQFFGIIDTGAKLIELGSKNAEIMQNFIDQLNLVRDYLERQKI